jgi:hypothetical protein
MNFFEKDARRAGEAAFDQFLGRLNLQRVDLVKSHFTVPLALAAAAAAGWILRVLVAPTPARKLRRRSSSRRPNHRPASRRAVGKSAIIAKVAH